MKRYTNLLLSIILAIVFYGCDDSDFLTERPKTIYTVDNAFEKSSQVEATLMKAYLEFADMFAWKNLYVEGNLACNLLGGDGTDVIGGTGPSTSAAGESSNFFNTNYTDSKYYGLWNQLYSLAAQANLAIFGSELVDWSLESDKEQAIAQSRFFRGWAYLRLAECFGGVPIVKEYSEELKFDYARELRKDVYAFSIEDLEYAAANLPQKAVTKSRLSKPIAQHFLAEAYLAQGVETSDASYYQKAVTVADQVINSNPMMRERFGKRADPSDTGTGYNGVPNYKPDGNVYYDLFQSGNYELNENTESLMIYEAPTHEQYISSGGRRFIFGATLLSPYRDIAWDESLLESNAKGGPWADDASAYLGGTSWGLIGSTDYSDEVVWRGEEYVNDIRNSQIVRADPVVTDQNHSKFGQVVQKEWLTASHRPRLMRISCKITMQDEWGFDPFHLEFGGQTFVASYGRDWYIARSSETYLLKAEAFLRNNQQAEALNTLNQVRRRSGAVDATDIDIQVILDERARELAWEEHRWPTLLRMTKTGGIGSESSTNESMDYQLSRYTRYVLDLEQPSSAPEWKLFPIPYTVMTLNSDSELPQNIGWKE